MEALTPGHLALILLAVILLFGYKKLPDASRSLGRSLRIFRSEMTESSTPPGAAGAAGREGAGPAVPENPTTSAAVLERRALQAEAEAAGLRLRAEAVGRPAQH